MDQRRLIDFSANSAGTGDLALSIAVLRIRRRRLSSGRHTYIFTFDKAG